MEQAEKLPVLITARGGSKRLPRKNILPFAGKPLIAWTIEQARASRRVDRILVSTDDTEIAEISKQWGAEVIQRPAELATDTATSFDVLIHALDTLKHEGYDPPRIVLLQPTSPLRTSMDIDQAIQQSDDHEGAMVVSVCELNNPAASWSFIEENGKLTPLLGWEVLAKRSQDVPKLWIPNGAVYVLPTVGVRRRGRIYGPPLLSYRMSVERSIDIDTQEEFKEAEMRFLKTP